MKFHTYLHFIPTPFSCSFCSKNFERSKDVELHLTTHLQFYKTTSEKTVMIISKQNSEASNSSLKQNLLVTSNFGYNNNSSDKIQNNNVVSTQTNNATHSTKTRSVNESSMNNLTNKNGEVKYILQDKNILNEDDKINDKSVAESNLLKTSGVHCLFCSEEFSDISLLKSHMLVHRTKPKRKNSGVNKTKNASKCANNISPNPAQDTLCNAENVLKGLHQNVQIASPKRVGTGTVVEQNALSSSQSDIKSLHQNNHNFARNPPFISSNPNDNYKYTKTQPDSTFGNSAGNYSVSQMVDNYSNVLPVLNISENNFKFNDGKIETKLQKILGEKSNADNKALEPHDAVKVEDDSAHTAQRSSTMKQRDKRARKWLPILKVLKIDLSRWFQCAECDSFCETQSILKRHNEKFHGRKTPSRLAKKTFPESESLPIAPNLVPNNMNRSDTLEEKDKNVINEMIKPKKDYSRKRKSTDAKTFQNKRIDDNLTWESSIEVKPNWCGSFGIPLVEENVKSSLKNDAIHIDEVLLDPTLTQFDVTCNNLIDDNLISECVSNGSEIFDSENSFPTNSTPKKDITATTENSASSSAVTVSTLNTKCELCGEKYPNEDAVLEHLYKSHI